MTLTIWFELRNALGGVHFVTNRDGYFSDRPKHMYTCAGILESRLFMPCIDLLGESIQDETEVSVLFVYVHVFGL